MIDANNRTFVIGHAGINRSFDTTNGASRRGRLIVKTKERNGLRGLLLNRFRGHRIYQARTCSRLRNASAPAPCKIARVAIIPAWMHVVAATVTERSGSTTGQP